MNDFEERLKALPPEKRAEVLRRLQERERAKAGAAESSGEAPAAYGDEAPLSSGQRQMWFLNRLSAGGGYRIPHILQIWGHLDVAALQTSIAALVARHEVLRTVFPERAGEPYQKILPGFLPEHWDVVDVGPGQDLRAAVEHTVGAIRFDLTQSTAFRARLFRVRDDEFVLAIVVHHIALDEWGLGIVMRELEQGYLAAQGKGSMPAAPKMQAAAFALWEQRRLEGPEFEQGLRYWTDRLKGAPPQIPWRTRASSRGPARQASFELSEPASRALETLSRQAGVSPSVVYLYAFADLVSRARGQHVTTVGMPMTARTRPEFEGLLGMMVNTVAVPVSASGVSLRQALKAFAPVWMGTLTNSWVPFDDVVRAVGAKGDAGRSPLFDVLLNYLPGGEDDSQFAGMRAKAEAVALSRTLYAALVTVFSGPQHRVVVAFDSHTFTPEESRAWIAAFERNVLALVAQPDDLPSDEQVLGADESLLTRAGELTPQLLLEALADLLPQGALPSQVIFVDELPRLPSGKVDRNALPRPDAVVTRDQVLPQTETQQRVFAVWAEHLKTEAIGIHDSFFEVGGHSLIAVRVQHALGSMFGVDVPLEVLFATPTIAGVAEWLDRHRGLERKVLTRRAYGELVPVAPEQRRMWFLQRLHPDSVAYQVPIATRIRGEFDVAAFRAAVDAFVARHELMRTVYPEHDGVPMQRILPHAEVPWTQTSCDTLDQARELLQDAVACAFDLSCEIPLRVTVVHVPDGVVLLMLMHHIAIDEWSAGVAGYELSELYAAHAQRRGHRLPAPVLQYADYAIWQSERLASTDFDEGLAFWRSQLEGAPSQIEWPLHGRHALPQARSQTLMFEWPEALSRDFVAFARRHGATTFSALFASFTAFAARVTGQTHLTLGLPVNQRHHEEFQRVVGMLLNTVPLSARVPMREGFERWVRDVHALWTRSLPHQWIPLEEIARATGAHQERGAPLFDTIFSFLPSRESQGSLPLEGLQAEGFDMGVRSQAKVPLVFIMSEHAGGLHGAVEYDESAMPRAFAQYLADAFRGFVEALLRLPTTPMAALDIGGAAALVGPTVPLPDVGIARLVEASARTHPDRVALQVDDTSWSYARLDARANEVANGLAALGVQRGAVVGLDTTRSADMVVAMIACAKIGAAYMPIPETVPTDRLRYMMENVQCRWVLHTEDRGNQCSSLQDVTCLRVSDVHGPSHAPAVEVCGDDLMCVLYTSGSTGRPKAVAMRHQTFVNTVLWKHRTYPFLANDAVLQKTPYVFDVASCEIFTALTGGARLVLSSEGVHRDPDAMIDAVSRFEVSHAEFVPSQLEMILATSAPLQELPLRHVFPAGEVLTPRLIQRFESAMPQAALHNQYGPTETFYTTHWTHDGVVRETTPVGFFVDNLFGKVVDRWLSTRHPALTGELLVGGAGLARGYASQPRETALKFIPDPGTNQPGARVYRTGDTVARDEQDALLYFGRADRQVKLRGQRVELDEVERALEAIAEVRRAAAVVAGADGRAENLYAYVEFNEGSSLSGDAVLDRVREALPHYMVPSLVMVMPRMPLTATGKLDRKALPAPDLSATTQEIVAPRNATESIIEGIWKEALGLTSVSIRADFFTMGGHSLLAVQVRQRLSRAFEFEIPLSVLFSHTTIERLAQYIEQCVNGASLGRQNAHTTVILRDGHPAQTVVMVHPIGGAVFCYQSLAEVWPGEARILGVQSPGLATGESLTTVEAMAQRYADELESEVRGSSCILLGWSFGGVVALELAHELSGRGVDVSRVVMLDTYSPVMAPDRDELEEWARFAADLASTVGLASDQFANYADKVMLGDFDTRVQGLAEAAREWSAGAFTLDEPTIRALFKVFDDNYRAYRTHSPKRTELPVTLLQATRVDPRDRGWGAVLPKLNVVMLETDHYRLVKHPWVVRVTESVTHAP